MGAKLSYPEVDLAGKVALVTGGNTGIGYETAKGLARLGAHTFIACRSKEKAEAAIERIKSELSPPKSTGKIDKKKGTRMNDGKDSAQLNGSTEKEGGSKVRGSNSAGSGSGEEGEGEGGIMKAAGVDEEVRSKEKQDCDSSCRKEVKVDFLPLDLSSFQSIVDCVHLFKEKSLPLHILVNNAGIFAVPYRKTGDGFESHFQVNHLGPMLLTLKLLPLLLETANTSHDVRIVFVASKSHYWASAFNSNTLDPTEANYKRLTMYSNSKMYTVMVGFALQRRLQGSFITVSSLCPSFVKTELSRGLEDKKFGSLFYGVISAALARSPEKGAANSLNCAANPSLNSQEHIYYDSCRPKQPSADARSKQFQEELWKKSCEFLKDHLSPETLEKYAEEKSAGPDGDVPKAEIEEISKVEGEEPQIEEDIFNPEEDDMSKPDQDDTSKPEEEDASKSEGEDVSKPVEEDTSKPVEEDISKPVGKDISKSEEEDMSKSESEDTSKPEEEDMSKPEEEDTSKPEEEDTSKPEEEDTSKPEEEDMSKPEGDMSKSEGEDMSKPEGEDMSKPEGDMSKSEGEDMSKPEEENS